MIHVLIPNPKNPFSVRPINEPTKPQTQDKNQKENSESR